MSTADAGGAWSSLDHVTVTVSDLAASCAFYDAVLGALGLARLDELVDEEEDDAPVEAAGWGTPGGTTVLWAVGGVRPSVGVHLSLRAASVEQVESFAAAAPRHGGVVRSAPRRWTVYRTGRFGAMVADPDGIVVEAVAPEA